MNFVGEHTGRGRSDIQDCALEKVHFFYNFWSSKDTKRHQKTPKDNTRHQKTPKDIKRHQKTPKDIKRHQKISCTSLDSMKAVEAGQGQGGSDEG